jgi:hypothetical protein
VTEAVGILDEELQWVDDGARAKTSSTKRGTIQTNAFEILGLF